MVKRLKTIIKQFGKPFYCDCLDEKKWKQLGYPKNNRIITIHHGENFSDSFYGSIGKRAVNTVGFLVFPNELPQNIETVIGINFNLFKGK